MFDPSNSSPAGAAGLIAVYAGLTTPVGALKVRWEPGKASVDITNTGWWYTYPSEKYEFVSWGYYSQYMEK